MKYLYHIARSSDWEQACKTNEYKIGSLKRNFEEDGFIHLSYARQVNVVADAIYKGIDNLVLLKIDPNLLKAEVKDEQADPIGDVFPHLYGALNTDSVIETTPYESSKFGSFPVVSEP